MSLAIGSCWDVIRTYGTFFIEIEESIHWLESMAEPITRPPISATPANFTGIGPFSAFLTQAGSLVPAPAANEPIELPKIVESGEGKFSQLVLFRLQRLEAAATPLGLKRTLSRLPHIKEHIGSAAKQIDTWNDDTLHHEIRILRESFRDDLKEQPIFLPNIAKTVWFAHKKPFGQNVHDAFDNLRDDITKAGTCYATDNDDACIFHLMRVVERAIRILAKRLHVERQLKHELDYEDWKLITKAINAKLDKLRNSKRGKKRENELNFYADMAERCQYFKEMWRDSVMHSRANYDQYQASSALGRVGDFLKRLAEGLNRRPP
jgi:dGTP triphosphohydrolase